MGGYIERKMESGAAHILFRIMETIVDGLWAWFSRLFETPVAVFNIPEVITLYRVSALLAVAMIALTVTYRSNMTSLRTAFHQHRDSPGLIMRQGIEATVWCCACGIWASFVGTFANLIREVLAHFGLGITGLEWLFQLDPGALIGQVFLQLVFLVMAVFLLVQRAALTIKAMVLYPLGPWCAYPLCYDDQPAAWNYWKRKMRAVFVTPLIQQVVLMLWVLFMHDKVDIPNTGKLLGSIGFAFVMATVDKWAGDLVDPTGLGSMGTSLVVNTGRMALATVFKGGRR